MKRRTFIIFIAIAMAFGSLQFVLDVAGAGPAVLLEEADASVYLPIVFSPVSPQGSYTCLEYEFGLIWRSEVITLYADGSSVYDYAPPYLATVTGTWGYLPAHQTVTFTNFTWPAATFRTPDRLWASRPVSDFEVALSCLRIVRS